MMVMPVLVSACLNAWSNSSMLLTRIPLAPNAAAYAAMS
jgi:hypothetical protein